MPGEFAGNTMEEPPEGVLAGESVPPENEESEFERLKRERVETLREQEQRLLDAQEDQ